MIKPLFVLLVCLIASALAENTVLSVSPTFSQTNPKNYVYRNDRNILSVEVSVSSYAKDDYLSLEFVDAENDESMHINPLSACVSADNKVVFSLSKGYLIAADAITTPTVCTYQARVYTDLHNVVFTRISDGNEYFDITPLTTIDPSIDGHWSSSLAHVGDVHTFTIKGRLPFAAKETFIVTASNGAPFTAATACVSEDGTLFSVSAQGSRMLFSARVALPEGFECEVGVTVGPTSTLTSYYSLSAPEHGYSTAGDIPGIMSVLNTADFHPRMGLVGAMTIPGENYDYKQASLSEATAEANVAPAADAAAPVHPAARGDVLQSKRMTAKAAKLEAKKANKAAGKRVRRTKEERVAAMTKAKKSFAASKAKSTMNVASLAASTSTYDNVMYLALPASSVRVGDTIKLYYTNMYGMNMGPCGHKNGTYVGTQEFVFEDNELTNSAVVASLTITAPPQVGKDNYVELYCPFTITDITDYDLSISVIAVRGGLFSATEFDDEIEEFNFFYNTAEFGALVYGKDLATIDASFFLDGPSDYVHFDVDVTLRGMDVADMDAFLQKCFFYYYGNQGVEMWTPTGVTVTDGNVNVKMGAAVLIEADYSLYMHCDSTGTVGKTISVFDNHLNKVIASDTIRAGSMRITYGDGVQTHYLDRQATPNPSPIPFTLDINNVYHQSAVDNGYTGLAIGVESYKISTPYPGKPGLFDLECSSGKVRTYQSEGYNGSPYARATYYVDGFNAKCTGTANIGVMNAMGDERLNFVSLQMTNPNGNSNYRADAIKSYPTIVQTPKIVTAEQFSFHSYAITLGSATTFTVGHTLLKKDGEFTLTFDHDVEAASSTCAVDETVVFECSVSADKRSLTCVKGDVQTAEVCELSLTFAVDLPRTIAVTTSFKGLPEGMVFSPAFSITAKGGSTSVNISPTFSGRDYQIAITLPRVPRTTDVLNITHIINDYGMSVFSHFEPSIGDSAAAAYIKDGFVIIPLTALDTAKATVDNLTVHFRHIGTENSYGGSLKLNIRMNDVSLYDTTVSFPADGVNAIVYAPSSASSLFPIIAMKRVAMSLGDTITIHDLTYPVDQPPLLYCDGLEGPITAVDSIFTIPAAVSAAQRCYAFFPDYTLTKGYWSFTIKTAINSYTISRMASARNDPAITVYADSSYSYVKDIPVKVRLFFNDFTTGTLTQDSQVVFSFDPAVMSVQKVSCLPSTGTYTGEIDGGVITIDFSTSSVPFVSRGNLLCIVDFTPLVATTDAKFTSVSVLGETTSDLALPAFRATLEPSVALNIDNNIAYVTPSTSVPVTLVVKELALDVGDTFSLALEGNDGQLKLTSCGNAGLDGSTIKVTQPTIDISFVNWIICNADVAYTSSTPVPVIVTWTRGDTTKTFTTTTPPASRSMIFSSLVSQSSGQAVYRINTRTKRPNYSASAVEVYVEASYIDDYSFTTDCPTDNQGGSSMTIYFTIPKGSTETSCLLTFTLDGSYDPSIGKKAYISLLDPVLDDYEHIMLPAIKSNKPRFTASINPVSATMQFLNNDANTVTVTNVWNIQATATAPVIIRSYTSGVEAGKLVASADGKLLTASFNADAMTVENGKYTLNEPCYFNTTGIHGAPLYVTSPRVTFTSGSQSVSEWVQIFTPAVVFSQSDAKIVSGNPYTVAMVVGLAGNPAVITVNHTNTALASVKSCGVAMNENDATMSTPVIVTAKGASFSFVLSEDNTVSTEGPLMLGMQCIFNTISAEEAQKKSASLANGIFVSAKTDNGLVVLPSSRVAVATPYFAPKVALSHSAFFSRSTLFNSTEIAALSKAYAVGLRRSVDNLKDNQVTIANQRLLRMTPAIESVPSPIKTLFNVNADNTMAIVGFTITPTDEVPVTVTDINNAANDLATAFADAGLTSAFLQSPDETIVDGECAYRCGLGCTLCAEGSTCSTHADCIDGTCNVNNECGPEPEYVPPTEPDNAAPAATISMAVLAVLVAVLMF